MVNMGLSDSGRVFLVLSLAICVLGDGFKCVRFRLEI